MTREIKFRVWVLAGIRGGIQESMYGPPRMLYTDDYEIKFLGNDCWADLGQFSTRDLVLMQFTGLKDKNGKEIYEGDLVKGKTHFGKEVVAEVIWNNRFAAFDYMCSVSRQYLRMLRDPEVAGNIYETRDK